MIILSFLKEEQEVSDNGIIFNLKKRHITIKVNDDIEYKTVIGSLKKKLPEFKKIYKNLNPEIYIMGKNFSNKEIYIIQKIVDKFFDVDVNFSCSKMLGLHGIRKTFSKDIAVSKTKFVRNSLRSGQMEEFEGSIVVLGDVNHGAQVIAGENIVILGILRGLAHAGAKGNKEAIISAGAIQANQIRIANIVKEYERDEIEDAAIKTNAYLNESDEIIIE